ncbi:L,D-transpeptidase family protein [Candidatus Woesearchaeota archaeon]|nr:L,D-transpeptidase family protein [Candidatus Woesearchaeota archaeon]
MDLKRREFMKVCLYLSGSVGLAPLLYASSFAEASKTEVKAKDGKSAILKMSRDRIESLLGEYYFNLQDYDKFRGWIDDTIESSLKTKRPAIIVDKHDYSLLFYEGGALKQTFSVELGGRPHADKYIEGDLATPEGLYHCNHKKDLGDSWFHKSLRLSYPMPLDKQEFDALMKKGKISPSDKIGGDIMIHGYGSGKRPYEGGANWTLGCVAMANDDIDQIFPKVNVFDKITVVKYGTNNELEKLARLL